jgi:universal stress protein A
MNAQRILFPTDFSHDNEAALQYASSLARETGAILYVVHVDEAVAIAPAMGDAVAYYYAQTTAMDRSEIRERLSSVVPTISDVQFEHHYLVGAPAEEILRFAEREGVDLIVMATHGRSGLARLLMGSVAEGVMRGAKCPIIIVKQPVGTGISEAGAERHEEVSHA